MKLGQILLLNVATIAIALVIYDLVRTESTASPGRSSVARSSTADMADFERRLIALESTRRPSLPDVGSERSFSDRLDALEAAEKANAAPGDGTADDTTAIDRGAPAKSARSEPSEADVDRFRKLREAARRQDAAKKNRARVDKVLDGLSINLTATQRKRIHTAFAAFEPRIGQIWGEVKTQARKTIENGGEVDRVQIVTSTTAIIQQEFAQTITDIVPHQADAEAISTALVPSPKTGKR